MGQVKKYEYRHLTPPLSKAALQHCSRTVCKGFPAKMSTQIDLEMHLKYGKMLENLQKIRNVEFGPGDVQETDRNPIALVYGQNFGQKRKKSRIL